MDMCRRLAILSLALCLGAVAAAPQTAPPRQTDPRETARKILARAGKSPGLVAVIGCGTGELLLGLAQETPRLVHGVDRSAAAIVEARRRFADAGLSGRVAADPWDGEHLPYADGLVNLLVHAGGPPAPRAELVRVLAPLGVLLETGGGEWIEFRQPWPEDIDEWTHYLHGPDNNAVAEDTRIGPPESLQWVGTPRWARHHDRMASMSSLVSAGGRIFTIFDDGPTSSIILPSNWMLIAREAFNGVVLWKRPIPEWQTRLWPLKSGPAQLPRRLVATADTVYATLGIDVPLTALDADTGEVLRTYEGSGATVEVLHSEGALYLVVDPELDRDRYTNHAAVNRPWWSGEAVAVKAYDAASGRCLWSHAAAVVPLTLAVDASRVYFHDGEKIVALERRSGDVAWRSGPVPMVTRLMSFFAPTLVVREGVVLFAGGEESGLVKSTGGATKNDTVVGLDAATGKRLWSAPHPPSGYSSPEDVFVIGDRVWFAGVSNGNLPGETIGLDLHTGEVRQRHEKATVDTYWFHHRCYRGKATSEYLMVSRTGIEFIDPDDGTWTVNHWVRGGCLYGFMPANGLIYAPPHACACYPETKLFGFCALSAQPPPRPTTGTKEELPVRGPAYDWRRPSGPARPRPGDWPTYRGDTRRYGFSPDRVTPTGLAESWSVRVGAGLTAVSVAEDVLLVARTDAHTLHALKAATGEPLWRFVAGGRIDSPPTIHEGTAIFGAADGWVTCLRLGDGEIVWQFRAAPAESRVVALDQIESRWPVHGSVLIQEGIVHAVAGRSLFLDGGMRYCRLDARTGQPLGIVDMDRRDPDSGEDMHVHVKRLTMPVALPDVLSSDGQHVYMRSQVFDMQGKRLDIPPHDAALGAHAAVQEGPTKHLFASAGFLDGDWFHRGYWVHGRSFEGGWNSYYLAGKRTPSGKILSVTPSATFGFGREPKYFKWTTPIEHHLFAVPHQAAAAEQTTETKTEGTLIRVKKSASLNPAGHPLAVTAWARADSPDGVVLAHGGGVMGYALYLKEGKCCFVVADKSKRSVAVSKAPVPRGWVHLAGVLAPDGELRVFVNGALEGVGRGPGLISSDPANELQVGGDEESQVGDYAGGLPFRGILDDVRVLHGDVTEDMVRRWAASPEPVSEPNVTCVLHFPLDRGNARDASGKGNHGEVIGAEAAEGHVGEGLAFLARMPGTAAEALVAYAWAYPSPILVRGMAATADILFVAGPEDRLDEPAALQALDAEETIRAQTAQLEGLKGLHGGRLLAVRCHDGRPAAELDLPTIPVWDGLAAARGRLYMAGVDGTVRCFAGKP